MQEAFPEAPAFGEADPGALQGHGLGALVELVLDSHRVVGEVRHGGAPRRLVDMMNAIDGEYLVVHDGQLDDPFHEGEAPRHFAVIHVHRNAILLAVPRADAIRPASPFEVVAKVPVPATIVLPGLEVAGNIHLAPDADPALAPLLASKHFMPLTDAMVVSVLNPGLTWQEPLVVVNLARALLYAPRVP